MRIVDIRYIPVKNVHCVAIRDVSWDRIPILRCDAWKYPSAISSDKFLFCVDEVSQSKRAWGFSPYEMEPIAQTSNYL
jgi:hypothetical protein